MTNAPSTCRGGNINQSGYWQPAMIDRNGNVLIPDGVLTYYKRGYQGVENNQIIQSPPAGLKMIAGNAMATTPGDGRTVFTCLRSNGTRVDPVSIGGCNAGDQMEMSVSFPQCWNGRDLDSPNHKSHMSYAVWGVGCPASHPVAITDIVMNVYYVRALREHGNSNGWRLVTDNYDGPGGFSAHADWWNGWAPDVMDTIVANCIRGGLDCRTDQLGDGARALYCNKGFKSPDDNGGYADFFICQ
jgi:hypothetical protein